ncbi:MAG: hypothetical protein ACLRW2_12655 [Parasutterella excrementihominis]
MTNQTRRDVLKKGLQVAAVGVGAGLIWDLFLQKSAKAQGFVPRPPEHCLLISLKPPVPNADCVWKHVLTTR